MIPFLPEKHIDFSNIEKILSKSKKDNHYTNEGPVKLLLEKRLEELLEVVGDLRVVCTSNGTTALHAVMMLCNKRGVKKWATPAFTFPSCVVGHGLDIDILDIELDTFTADPKELPPYDGIILTNLFGSFVDVEFWSLFCANNGKKLIFDNAASALSKYENINICSFGNYSIGSLHHTKYLGFGEGGFIVCPKEDYDELIAITNFGFFGNRDFKKLSSNFKMSDVSAAFILEHINNYDIDQHINNQEYLIDKLSDVDFAEPFNYKPGTVYNTFPVLFKKSADTDYFLRQGIKAHKYYKPLADLQNSNDVYDRIINFPLYSDMNKKMLDYIVDMIKQYGWTQR